MRWTPRWFFTQKKFLEAAKNGDLKVVQDEMKNIESKSYKKSVKCEAFERAMMNNRIEIVKFLAIDSDIYNDLLGGSSPSIFLAVQLAITLNYLHILKFLLSIVDYRTKAILFFTYTEKGNIKTEKFLKHASATHNGYINNKLICLTKLLHLRVHFNHINKYI